MKIISRTGGGLLGLIAALIEARLGIIKADVDIGDSVGALVSAMRKIGKSPAYIAALMMRDGDAIFPRSLQHDVESMRGFASAKYPSGPLREILHHELGNICFGDLDSQLWMPSINLSTDSPYWFHNGQDDKILLVDGVMASCAALGDFPSYPILGLGNFGDGGITCHAPQDKCVHLFGAQNIEALISFGTGDMRHCNPRTDALDWGAVDWLLKDVVGEFLRMRENESDMNCRLSLGDKYRAINPPCETIDIDDTSKITRMKDIAEDADLGDVPAWLREKGFSVSSVPSV